MSRRDGKDRGIFERPKGSGIWWVRYTDEFGREHREKVGPKGLAQDVYRQRKTEIRLQKFDPEGVTRRKPWTVARMFEHYRELRAAAGPKNQVEDRRYAAYWTNRFGTLELDQLRPAQLEQWRAERLKQVKPATVNRALTYLKAYYNLACKDGYCKTNPVRAIRGLPERNQVVRYLNEAEEARLEAELGEEAWDVVRFSVHTGLRMSEQFELPWTAIDQAACVLTVRESKSGGVRYGHLNPVALEVLERQRARYPRSRWVFPDPTDPTRHRNPKNFQRRTFRPALERAGIQDFTWHCLRHTFASRLTMAGVHQRAVQELLGHKSGRMTERYSHLSPGHLQEAVSRLSGSPGERVGASEPAPKPALERDSTSRD